MQRLLILRNLHFQGEKGENPENKQSSAKPVFGCFAPLKQGFHHPRFGQVFPKTPDRGRIRNLLVDVQAGRTKEAPDEMPPGSGDGLVDVGNRFRGSKKRVGSWRIFTGEPAARFLAS